MRELTGQCLCGAVTVSLRTGRDTFNACNCGMCRRWTGGGRYYSIFAAPEELTIEGRDRIAERQTSDWAARANCADCGTPIWYRPTAPAAKGGLGLSLGLFDDISGLTLRYEYFSDLRPAAFDETGTTYKPLTTAQTIAMFAPSDEGEPQ